MYTYVHKCYPFNNSGPDQAYAYVDRSFGHSVHMDQSLLFLYRGKTWFVIHLQVGFFFYCLLLFFLILFLLFIVLQGAVCYPLELRLTRIGLIWHQASVVDFHIVKSTSPPPSRRTCQDVQAVSSGSLAISLTATSTCPGPHSHA